MSTPYIHLDFVCLSDYSNQRARELTTSFARSHASKVTYLKKKKKKSARASGRTFEDQHENKALLDVCARIQAARDGLPASDSPLTYVPHTINYYLDNVVPNLTSPYHIFGVKVFWNDQWLRCVSQEPFYSAFSASQQLNRDQYTQPYSTAPSTRLLEHKLRAIQHLRQQLADGISIDDTALHAMMKLAFVEARLGNGSLYDMHRDTVSKFIQERGIGKSDACLSPLISAHDLYRRMQTSFPALPAPQISGPSAEGDLLTRIATSVIERLPKGFQQLAVNGKIPLELLRALHRTNPLFLDRAQEPLAFTDQPKSKIEADTSDQRVHDTFWTACPSLLACDTSSDCEPGIGNLLALGLWLYVALEFSSHSIYETVQHWISTARWIRQDLTNKLRLCVQIRPDDEEYCLKWLINIAIQSWRNPGGELPSDGFGLNSFRGRRFPWFGDVNEGFFPFTKGSSLESPLAGPRVHRSVRIRLKRHVNSSRKSQRPRNARTRTRRKPLTECFCRFVYL